jgi:predicted lipid carrier protein YhbT
MTPIKAMLGSGVDARRMATDLYPTARPWLRWIPPPARLAPLLALLPARLRQRAFERAAMHALSAAFAEGALADLRGRRIGVEIVDLELRFVVEVLEQRLVVLDPVAMPDTCVRGTLTDLLQLASRSEDADTLFFQRRLTLTGDVELGLRVRNLLDQLPWEQVPLGARILLHRGARFAAEARDAYRATH